MKKIFLLMFALLISMAFAMPAVSATFCDGTNPGQTCTFGSSTFGGGEYRPSSKVTVDVTGTTGLAYCASSQHSGASTNPTAGRQYYTMSTSPQILFAPSRSLAGPEPCGAENTPPAGTWSN